jgi:two-component system sensor histidine kinase QseC
MISSIGGKNSIRKNLFISISLLVIATFVVMITSTFIIANNRINRVFDADLVKDAKLLLSLSKHEIIEHEIDEHFVIDLGVEDERIFHRDENKIHFQIWKRDRLIYNSSKDFLDEKPIKEGFHKVKAMGYDWNGFAIYDKDSELTIDVMEQELIRKQLIGKVILFLSLPLLLALLPILFTIWFLVKRGTSKLVELSQSIENISPTFLKPFENEENLPTEVKPLIHSLNALMLKLNELILSEREFIDYSSHEIRTPLTTLKVKLGVLIKKYQHDAELLSSLNQLLNQIDRVVNISDQLLMLTRAESEARSIEKENIDLGHITALLVEDMIESNPECKIVLKMESDKKYLSLLNRYHAKIIIKNLIENAVKYGAKDHEIVIGLKNTDSGVVLTVDNSLSNSLQSSSQNEIFKPFYRDASNRHNIAGSGLGLSIVKKILDIYGGKILLNLKRNKFLLTIVWPKSDLFA